MNRTLLFVREESGLQDRRQRIDRIIETVAEREPLLWFKVTRFTICEFVMIKARLDFVVLNVMLQEDRMIFINRIDRMIKYPPNRFSGKDLKL